MGLEFLDLNQLDSEIARSYLHQVATLYPGTLVFLPFHHLNKLGYPVLVALPQWSKQLALLSLLV